MSNPEAPRIRAAYADSTYATWTDPDDWCGRYHPRHGQGLGLYGRRALEQAVVAVLNEAGVRLGGRTVLDLGCGPGIHLRFLVELGASPERCHGIDLMEDRIAYARSANPAMTFTQGDALDSGLEGPFDIVCQFTALSNQLEDEQRQQFANEMRRLVAPGGVILWHDIARQRTTQVTREVPVAEVRELLGLEPVAERMLFHHWTASCVVHGFRWMAEALDEHAPQRLLKRSNYVAVFRA